MTKISLKSIQNNVRNGEIKEILSKPIEKQVKVKLTKNVVNKPDFNQIMKEITNTVKFKELQVENTVVPKVINYKESAEFPLSLSQTKDVTFTKQLTEHERDKLIGLLHLYIVEFPDKLKSYKIKNLHKMDDSSLLELKEVFKKEVTTSNNLSMAVETSVKLLEIYEFACCNFGINIKGMSKISESEEYKQTLKAVLLKYFDNSLVSQVEPEYKLAYLIISNSLICH
jgi:hypothetical protein